MSRSYTASIDVNLEAERQAQRERERQERLERERQKRIERERQLIAKTNGHTQELQERLKVRQAKLIQINAEIEKQRNAELTRIEEQTQQRQKELEASIQATEAELEKTQQQIAAAQAHIETLSGMDNNSFAVFQALEEVMKDWGDARLTGLQQMEEEFVIQFTSELEPDRNINVALETSDADQAKLKLDITHGFEGGECDTFIEQVQLGFAQRGTSLNYKPDTSAEVRYTPPTAEQRRNRTRNQLRNTGDT